jgi:radical SAM protein with 4Fe4S-binding SPASM domain
MPSRRRRRRIIGGGSGERGKAETSGPQSYRKGRSGLYEVNDGKGVMFVGHTGIIQPSGFLPITCGRFPEEHLVEVYTSSSIFQSLRDPERLEGKCSYCEYRQICGGSRARAYAVTGNMFAQEPDCLYRPRNAAR